MIVHMDDGVMDAVRLLRSTTHEYAYGRPTPEGLRAFLTAVIEALGSDGVRFRWRLLTEKSAVVWLEPREEPASFA